MDAAAPAASFLPEAPYNEKIPLLKGERQQRRSSCFSIFLGALGPGLLVCLADTDAGGLFTAGQSGAEWGYSFVLWELVLIPFIYVAQDLTIRLGVHAKKGLTACIRSKFGPMMAWLAAILLIIECIFAVMSELSGLDSVAQLWGADQNTGAFVAAAVLIGTLLLLTYRQVELVGITLGLFSLSFVVSMFLLHPSPSEIFQESIQLHPSNQQWLLLVASNIGSACVPWMIFFQTSAVAARGLDGPDAVAEERMSTAVGSCLTQLVSVGFTVSIATALGVSKDISSLQEFVNAMEPYFGLVCSKLVVSASFLGGSLCAAFVVVLAPAWALSEAAGTDMRFAMDLSVREAPVFYGTFVSVVVIAVLVLTTGVDLVELNVYIELLDAMFLPFSLLMAYLITMTEFVPIEERLSGSYKWLLAVVFSFLSAVSLVCGITSLI